MKSTPQKNQRKKVTAIIIVVILLIVAAVGVYVVTQNKNKPSTEDTTTTDSTIDKANEASQDAQEKQDFLDSETKKANENDGDNTPDQSTTPDSSTISLKAQTEGDKVVITTNLSTISAGTCTLTITGEGTSITKTAAVIFTPEYSSCAGFSVKKTELNASTWSIQLQVKADSKTYTKTISHSVG